MIGILFFGLLRLITILKAYTRGSFDVFFNETLTHVRDWGHMQLDYMDDLLRIACGIELDIF